MSVVLQIKIPIAKDKDPAFALNNSMLFSTSLLNPLLMHAYTISYFYIITSIAYYFLSETGSPSNQLRWATVTALSHSECDQFFGETNVLDQHLCVMGMDTPTGAGACLVSNNSTLSLTITTL